MSEGGTAHEPDEEPVREGYLFTGWYLGSGAVATPYDFSAPVYENITLHAHYEESAPADDYAILLDEESTLREAVDRRPERGERAPTPEELLEEISPEGRAQPIVWNHGPDVEVDPETVNFRIDDWETVNFSLPGSYEVTLTAALDDGEELEAALRIEVVDSTPPEIRAERRIALSGRVSDIGELLALAGAAAEDNCDESVAINAYLLGLSLEEVDWSTSGQYLLYLEAADSSGNEAIRRVVIVGVSGSGSTAATQTEATARADRLPALLDARNSKRLYAAR